MKNTIKINNQQLQVKQFKNQRVITFKEIDAVHNRPSGTARKRFNDNKKHFINGTDYFKITPSEFRTAFGNMDIRQQNNITILTESGYLMLVKSFTDDLAWEVQRQLVNNYFRVKEVTKPSNLIPERPYEYFDKTYNGQPVLTSADVTYFTGIGKDSINYHLRTNDFIYGQDYYIVKSRDLERFKAENPNKYPGVWIMNLITESGFNKICEKYGILTDKPKCFIQVKNPPKEPSVISKICDKYNIELHALTEKNAKYFGCDMKTAVGQEFTIKKDGRYHIFYDTSADKYERQLMVSRGIGAVLAGQFREHDNDVDYTEEARIFSVVLSALAMFSEFGGFSQPNK